MFLSWVKENRASIASLALVLGVFVLFQLFPDLSFAYGGSGFENKMESINSSLITKILPLLSVLGLVYSAILAIQGDGDAKGKILMVMIASVVGFMAPLIIEWLKSIAM
jgi:hypothetical protein